MDLYAYRDTLIANDQIRTEARARVASRKATLEDLRLLSVGPMSQGDYLHTKLITMPGKKSTPRDRHQTTGAQQLMGILSGRGDAASKSWIKTLQSGGG